MDIPTYDSYVRTLLKPKLEECEFYASCKNELDDLLLSIPHEGPAYEIAWPVNLEKPNFLSANVTGATVSSGSCGFTLLLERSPSDLDSHFDILIGRYGQFHNLSLAVLLDCYLTALGLAVRYFDMHESTPLYRLLWWYGLKSSAQNEYSIAMYLRACTSYSQECINSQDKIKQLFINMARHNQPPERLTNLDSYYKTYRKRLMLLCSGVDEDRATAMESHIDQLYDNIRITWVHRQSESEKIQNEISSLDILNRITHSFHGIIYQHEGFYRWYCDPHGNSLL